MAWDVVAFAAAATALALARQLWLPVGTPGRRVTAWRVAAHVGVIALAAWYADRSGAREIARLQGTVAGLAPTYARELEELGHARIALDTPPDDPTYLTLIEAQKRWLAVNPTIADVYTLRMTPTGEPAFIVDSETDYDRDGDYLDDREGRTEIGELYTLEEGITRALAGEATFDDTFTRDRWGDWMSAWVPLHRPDGTIDGVLGVDYPAASWIEAVARARRVALAHVLAALVALSAAITVLGALQAELERRKEAERELSRNAGRLEQRVAERTVQLVELNRALERQIVEREQAESKLIALHARLGDASRRAGMAEVASDVLHNVGNVLTSLLVSAQSMDETLRSSHVDRLQRAVARMKAETSVPADRLLAYLDAVVEHLVQDQRALSDELTELRRHVEHVRRVVSAQQTHARHFGEVAEIDPMHLVDDALQICGLALARHGAVVERGSHPVPQVQGDPHRVLQILVNLLHNAAEAVDGCPRREIGVEVTATPDGGVRFVVRDTGVGFDEAARDRLFTRGYTTKAKGHGFGLVGSRDLAEALGGSLSADSAGPGTGARFTLELPPHPPVPDESIRDVDSAAHG